MTRIFIRHWGLAVLLLCASLITPASNAAWNGEAPQNMKFCNMYMGCSCKCKVGSDSRRWHEGNESSHYDVLCPTCNKFAKEKQKKNIRSGYFCSEKNDWVN